MTKSDLVARISADCSITAHDARAVIDVLLDAIASALANGDRVEIRGFGSFSTRLRPSRTGRNPATGERVQVPPKRIPAFRPSKQLLSDPRCGPHASLDELMAQLPPEERRMIRDWLESPPVGRELI